MHMIWSNFDNFIFRDLELGEKCENKCEIEQFECISMCEVSDTACFSDCNRENITCSNCKFSINSDIKFIEIKLKLYKEFLT